MIATFIILRLVCGVNFSELIMSLFSHQALSQSVWRPDVRIHQMALALPTNLTPNWQRKLLWSLRSKNQKLLTLLRNPRNNLTCNHQPVWPWSNLSYWSRAIKSLKVIGHWSRRIRKQDNQHVHRLSVWCHQMWRLVDQDKLARDQRQETVTPASWSEITSTSLVAIDTKCHLMTFSFWTWNQNSKS